MSGFWLVSYLALWLLVGGLAVLLVGALRQIGMLHVQHQQFRPAESANAEEAESIPPLEDDGPAIGSPLPAWVDEQTPAIGDDVRASTTLLMFMSPLCDTCQAVVAPLNALAADTVRVVRIVAIFRADRPAYEAFLKLFPLHAPSLRDGDRRLTMEMGVHRAPFGLLYDQQGTLIRKGLVEGEEDLAALLGDEAVSEAAQMRVYPHAALATNG